MHISLKEVALFTPPGSLGATARVTHNLLGRNLGGWLGAWDGWELGSEDTYIQIERERERERKIDR